MSGILNIVRIIALIVAVVAAFIAIPHVAAALVILGIVAGIDTPQDRRLHVMVSALVLTGLNGTLAAIPVAGVYLANITGNIGIALAGVSFTVIAMAIYERIIGGSSSSE